MEIDRCNLSINADRCARVPEEEVQPIDAESFLGVPTQQEFVIDQVVAHGTDPETGSMLVRISWHGFSQEGDTWENPKEIPRLFVETYARRKRMRVGRFIDEANNSTSCLARALGSSGGDYVGPVPIFFQSIPLNCIVDDAERTASEVRQLCL
jgi:hypothetical protein